MHGGMASNNPVGLLERTVEHLLSVYDRGWREGISSAASAALLDFILCTAAGSERAATWLTAPGECGACATVLGRSQRATPKFAAKANAVAAHLLDLDDLHWPSLSHPGAFVWPVALALGEREGAHGNDVLRAVVVGYELTIRLSAALGAEHRRFFHASTTAGIVGATLCAALVAGANSKEAATACAHALSVSPSLGQHLLEHSGTGHFHRMMAAEVAILAADVAMRGLGGDRFGLEGDRGLFRATAAGGSAQALLEERERWGIEEISFRYFKTTGYAQAAVEAALALGPIVPTDVEEITLEVPSMALVAAGIREPASAAEAWWSLPHAVSACLVYGEASRLGAEDVVQDGMVRRLTRAMQLVGIREEGPPRPFARLSVRLRSGEWRVQACSTPRGHPERPFQEEDWRGKARSLGLRLGDDGVRMLRDHVAGFHRAPVREWVKEVGRLLVL